LFEISHFIGDRDWFDGIVESNCLFVPRAVLDQYGGFDDSFAMPGGGYANLDLFERIGIAPGINVASILGEGTFHQVHGGTTTNVADEDLRRERVSSYREHFEELRGRPLIGLDRPVHFVGAMSTKAARRTRSRRHISGPFSALRDPSLGDAQAQRMPVPEELRHATTEALWYHQSWRDTTWMGRPLHRLPNDLQVYQELLVELQPETILLIADDPGLAGRAHLMASLCDLRGGGQVVAVGPTVEPSAADRPRLRTSVATPEGAASAATAILEEVGSSTVSLVLLGLGSKAAIEACFEQVSGLVPTGGFVVVENTVVNGRPVAPEHGPGPHEAVVSILGRHPEFVADPAAERYALTFNRGGYLRRREVRPPG
jgi:cephalosporin hydroxylase